MSFPQFADFPRLYMLYSWCTEDHETPDDWYNGFPWIRQIEEAFQAKEALDLDDVVEVVRWGGSQRGPVERVRNANTDEHVTKITREAFEKARGEDWQGAIEQVLKVDELGLTYASKLLRFRFPHHVGAVDSFLREGFGALIPAIYDGNHPSMAAGLDG